MCSITDRIFKQFRIKSDLGCSAQPPYSEGLPGRGWKTSFPVAGREQGVKAKTYSGTTALSLTSPELHREALSLFYLHIIITKHFDVKIFFPSLLLFLLYFSSYLTG